MTIKQKIFAILTASMLGISTLSYAGSVNLDEFYSVEIKNIHATLDNVPHDVTVNITWNFKLNPTSADYIDSNLIVSNVKKFLTDYPNKSDFFEVVNHNLAAHLMDKFKQLHGMSIKITVPATKMDPYNHYTEVHATR